MGIIETEDYLNNQLQIENRHDSLLTLIDTIYPPQLCTLCDNIFNSTQESKLHYNEKHKRQSRYLCIHPHCDQRFISKGALRFHISRSHLVINAPKKDLHPSSSSTTSSPIISPILHSPIQPPSSVSISSTILSSSSPPMSKKRKKKQEKKPLLLDDDDLSAPSPPPSPFSLYNKKLSKKPILSSATESLLDSVYPPTQCPACLKVFNKKTNVIKHLAQVHSGQEPYRCIYPKCNHPRLYATREGLVYHLVRIHNEQ